MAITSPRRTLTRRRRDLGANVRQDGLQLGVSSTPESEKAGSHLRRLAAVAPSVVQLSKSLQDIPELARIDLVSEEPGCGEIALVRVDGGCRMPTSFVRPCKIGKRTDGAEMLLGRLAQRGFGLSGATFGQGDHPRCPGAFGSVRQVENAVVDHGLGGQPACARDVAHLREEAGELVVRAIARERAV